VLYLAEDQVAYHEIQAFGWPAAAPVIVPVRLDLKAVIDLRDLNVQTLLRTNSTELAFNFRSLISGSVPTQILGERCVASGRIDGLLFESPVLRGKADLAVLEVTLALLGLSLEVNDPQNQSL